MALLTRIEPSDSLHRAAAGAARAPLQGSCGSRSPPSNATVSKHLIATFSLSPSLGKVAIVGAHLIAYPTQPERCSQREGQAQVLRGVINDLMGKGYEVAVMGDMNDFDGVTSDVQGSKPTSRVLSMLKDPDGDGVDELRSVSELIPEAERYSNWHDARSNGQVDSCACGSNATTCKASCSSCTCEYSQIDHILLSPRLWSKVIAAGIDHRHDPTKISDHFPIWVTIDTSA